MNRLTQLANIGAGVTGAVQQLHRGRWRTRRTILFLDAMAAAFLAQVFAQQLPGLRMQQADIESIPLHRHTPPDPAWRRTVVSRCYFHAAVKVHDALTVFIKAEGLQW